MATEPVPAQVYLDPEPRSWPMVIGILGALWGGMGAVTAGFALAGVGQEAQPALMRGGVGSAFNAVSMMLGVALLVGGVQLARRKVAGVRLMQAWAPLAALAQGAVLAIMLTHREEFERSFREEMERQSEARAAKSGQASPAMPAGMEKIMFGVGLGCGGFAAIVPPVIVAVFVFGPRGREALAEWGDRGAA